MFRWIVTNSLGTPFDSGLDTFRLRAVILAGEATVGVYGQQNGLFMHPGMHLGVHPRMHRGVQGAPRDASWGKGVLLKY